jgi:hypothetical protein
VNWDRWTLKQATGTLAPKHDSGARVDRRSWAVVAFRPEAEEWRARVSRERHLESLMLPIGSGIELTRKAG